MKRTFQILSLFLGIHRKGFLVWLVVAFAVYFYFLVPPYLVGVVLSRILERHESPLSGGILQIVGLLILVGIGASWIRLESKRRLRLISVKVHHEVRSKGSQFLFSQELESLRRSSTGRELEILYRGSDAIERFLN
jgi:ABC-type multidrug transport system fused ATPase/permease subunit